MQPKPSGYRFNLDDPRAPSQAVWDAMSATERADFIARLPSEFPLSEAHPPEGDDHFERKVAARDVLTRYFRKQGRGAYISCELPVYYPNEAMFAPDVMVVLDVDPAPKRNGWVVSREGKGLDVAIEIHVLGHRLKDVVKNVARYARLGIREYFVYEVRRSSLRGYRLTPGAREYQPVLMQGGLLGSEVLGLELGLDHDRLRFFSALAPLPEADELIERLNSAVDIMAAKNEEAERRAEEESRRAEEESRRAEASEQKLAEALAELARLKGEGKPPH